MKFSQAKQGRVFVIRLEDGDMVHETIERFAVEQGIQAAALIIIGGADGGSKLVVGPEEGRGATIVPMTYPLDEAHEVAGTGTLFCDEADKPLLHMHMACGRKSDTITGCVREGVKVWHIMEVILFELVDCSARRVSQPPMGWKFLRP
ncbi:MAG: DNA-binding protein [Desulfobacteraceae bacterium]|nr:DNA-binding protein [Desulfobacteraceae bacterium]